jgi:hypothetical protein
MANFGKVLGICSVLGVSGVALVANTVLSVASGKPVDRVVKDVVTSDFAKDVARSEASKLLFGGSDNSGLNTKFQSSKYVSVSDKGSSIINYWSPKWYSEVYRVDNDAYIGNRHFNKPSGVNMCWSMANGSDFEIGDYKRGSAYRNSYIAYDSESFTLTIGELKKSKLNGYILVFDEYNQTYKLVEYKKGKTTGYSLVWDNDDTLKYYKDDKKIGSYDTDKKKLKITAKSSLFSKYKQPDIKIKFSDNEYTFSQDDYKLSIEPYTNSITYKSDYCSFEGNAYKFDCTYNLDKDGDDWFKYTYTTMTNIELEGSDGTVGEIIAASSEDSEDSLTVEAFSDMIINFGISKVTDTLVNAGFSAIPELSALDKACGGMISGTISDKISDMVSDSIDSDDDDSITDDISDSANNVYDNLSNEDDYHSLGDKIKDGLGIETYEEQKEEEQSEKQERAEQYFTDSSSSDDSSSSTEDEESYPVETSPTQETQETYEDAVKRITGESSKSSSKSKSKKKNKKKTSKKKKSSSSNSSEDAYERAVREITGQ